MIFGRKKMDVIYPLSNRSIWRDNELRYSLRSLDQNFSGIGEVWIVGHKPKWLTNVRHIPFPDAYSSNKDANIINKILRVCFEKELSEKFIFMSDDQYILQRTTSSSLQPICDVDLYTVRHWGKSTWFRRLKRTFLLLKAYKRPAYHYDCHTPQVMSKDLFPKVMLRYNYGYDIGYTINTLYFNSLYISAKNRLPASRVSVRMNKKSDDYKLNPEYINGKLFLNHSDEGLTNVLKDFLKSRFTKKSSYEKSV